MQKSKILLSSFAALVILNSNVLADSKTLDSVDVWETEVVSSSLNLGKDVIETKQADHLSDLLRNLPGVDVGGTHSINNRLNIRGLQDENLDITIDGAKVQNANMFHHIGNLLINPDILKKASIEVGTNSVVNGSLGGSAEFVTKDGKDMLEKGKDFGARVSTTYNSNSSIGASVTAYGEILENADFLIYHNHLDKGNWKDGEGTEALGAEGIIENTLLKFGINLNDTNRISISYDKLKDAGDYAPRPDFGREYNEARTGLDTFDTQYIRETITLKHDIDLGDSLLLNTTIYTNENELERYEGPLTSGKGVRPGKMEGLLNGKVKTVGINTKAQSNIGIGNTLHTLTYGILYDKQSSAVTWDGAKYGANEEAKSTAVYLEDSIDFDNGLVLIPGLRYNKYDFDGAYGEINDSEVTYGLSTQYSINEDFTLLANVTTLYKGVEMLDVLATNRLNSSAVQSANLKSETGINKEIGFKYITSDILGADDIGFSFKYFHTTINDYITNEWASNWSYNYMTNSGNLDIKGFEASFAYNKNNLSSLLTYSRSSSEFEETGEPTIQEPGDSISLAIDYKISSNLELAWESLFVAEEDDIPSGTAYRVKESYNIHDIAIKWSPSSTKGLSVVTGVDNIFDKVYSSHISENRMIAPSPGAALASTKDYEPGRNFKVTLAYKF